MPRLVTLNKNREDPTVVSKPRASKYVAAVFGKLNSKTLSVGIELVKTTIG